MGKNKALAHHTSVFSYASCVDLTQLLSFTLCDLHGKPRSHVSSLLPPGACLHFVAHIIRSIIPTSQLFMLVDFASIFGIIAHAIALSTVTSLFFLERKSINEHEFTRRVN